MDHFGDKFELRGRLEKLSRRTYDGFKMEQLSWNGTRLEQLDRRASKTEEIESYMLKDH